MVRSSSLSPGLGLCHEVGRELLERALGRGARCLFILVVVALRVALRAQLDLVHPRHDAVRDVLLEIELGDARLLQHVDRVGLGLLEDLDQHRGAVDGLLLAAHHVDGGAAQDALDAERLLRGDLDVLRQLLDLFGQELLQLLAQLAQVGAAGGQRVTGASVIDQRVEQVLQRHVLVTVAGRLFEGVAKRDLQRAGDHGGLCHGSVVLRFQGEPERELVLARELLGLAGLHLGDFERVHTGDADALVVDMQHDARGRRLRVVENLSQHFDHELARGVVVVVQQHFVEGRALDLFPSLGLGDHALVVVGLRSHRPLLGHAGLGPGEGVIVSNLRAPHAT
jgi:hypothetical protein